MLAATWNPWKHYAPTMLRLNTSNTHCVCFLQNKILRTKNDRNFDFWYKIFDVKGRAFNFSFFVFHFSFLRFTLVLSFQTIFIQKIFRFAEDLQVHLGVVLRFRNQFVIVFSTREFFVLRCLQMRLQMKVQATRKHTFSSFTAMKFVKNRQESM